MRETMVRLGLLLSLGVLAPEAFAADPATAAAAVQSATAAAAVQSATTAAAVQSATTAAVAPPPPAGLPDTGAPSVPGISATAPASATVAAATSAASGPVEVADKVEVAGPLPPEAMVAIGAESLVSLSWLPSPSDSILGYNVYRSTEEGVYGTIPVNRSLVTGTEFIDNETNSTQPPGNGVIYYYTIKTVDSEGRLSDFSEEARARPEGAPVISEIPKVGWEGFGDSQLSVSGRKVVSIGRTIRVPKHGPGTSQLSGSASDGWELKQQLQVRLQGSVGKKISVDVDYDDTAPDQTRQRISVVYAGDAQETIERAEFGDIRLRLAETEFTGYDKQLFGVRLQTRPWEKLRVTGIATQTQGIKASEQFVGSKERQELTISDMNYIAFKYFYISNPRTVLLNLGIKPGTEQIWMDDGIPTNNIVGVTVPAKAGFYNFDRMQRGVDYSIDYNTGVIVFNRSVSSRAAIAAAFEYGNGIPVYFGGNVANDPDSVLDASLRSNWDVTATWWAETTTDAHLIFDSQVAGAGDAHMITNIYQIGHRNIIPARDDDEFAIKILDANSIEVLGVAVAILDTEFYDFGILRLVGDPTTLPCRAALGPPCAQVPPPPLICNPCLPGGRYPPVSEQPFAYSPEGVLYAGDADGNAYRYGLSSNRFTKYTIKIRFLTRELSYRLDNINIVRGSERITLDGRLLSREVDYIIDYDFGNVQFLRQEQIRPNSVIRIDYEYLPFGGQFQSFLWGARAEYSLSDKSALGITYLSNNSQNPQDVPSPSAAPQSTQLMGLDGRTFLSRRDLSQVVRVFPGFEHTVVPLEMELRGEIARSKINPNTFKQSGTGERGSAMIDGMEGADDVVSVAVDASLWFPAASWGLEKNDRTEQLAWHTGVWEQFGQNLTTLDIQFGGLVLGKWDALRYVLSPVAIDLTHHQFMELRIWSDGAGNFLTVDIGSISEDSNGDGKLTFEDLNGDFTLNEGEDVGIDNCRPTPAAPAGPCPYWGSGNTGWSNGWPGPGSEVLNTEDMNGNGVLDDVNRYFSYRIQLNWIGWALVKIPLGFDRRTVETRMFDDEFQVSRTPLDGLSVATDMTVRRSKSADAFLNVFQTDDRAVIRHVRLRLEPAPGSNPGGLIRIESLQITGNRWLLSTTPGSMLRADSSRFNVSVVNQETAGAAGYQPLLTYFQVREPGGERFEQALRIEYNLYDDLGGNYYATRIFPGSINMLNYRELKFDIYKTNVVSDGEILFVRAGGDDRNYYQYNVSLDHIGLGWQTVSIDIQDDRNRKRVGTPALSAVRQFSIGVMRLDPQDVNLTESFLINNLRLVDPEHKVGLARKVNIRMSTPMGATFLVDPSVEIMPAKAGIIVDTTYREVDNDFRLIDQPLTIRNDQHQRSLQSVAQIRQIPKMPITARFSRNEAYVESQHRNDPQYFFAPDKVTDSYDLRVSSQHLNPLAIDVVATRMEETVKWLTGLAGQDWNRVNWSVAPSARIPLDGSFFYIPLGRGGEASAGVRYSKDRVDYIPTMVSGRRDQIDRTMEHLDERYEIRTTYRPFGWLVNAVPLVGGLSSTPRASYGLRRSKGVVGSLQSANIQNAGTFASADRFRPITQDIGMQMDNRLEGIKGMTPSVNYQANARRDYDIQSLSTTGSVTNSMDLRPGEWVSSLRDHSFNFSYAIDTNAQYHDTTTMVGDQKVTLDPVTRRVPLREIWWIKRKDNALSASNRYSETYNVSGRMAFWQTISLSPSWTSREAISLRQKLRDRRTTMTAGTTLSLLRRELVTKFFGYTPIFWMKLSGFESSYNYRESSIFNDTDQAVSGTKSHALQGSMSFMPIKNVNGTLQVQANESESWTAQPETGVMTATRRRNLQPSAGLGYTKSAGLEFPLLWWRIKLANLFTIRDNFSMNFIDNVGDGPTGTRRAWELSNVTEFEYEMMRGVNLRVRAQYDKVKDKTTPKNTHSVFTFLGTFTFNF